MKVYMVVKAFGSYKEGDQVQFSNADAERLLKEGKITPLVAEAAEPGEASENADDKTPQNKKAKSAGKK